MHLAWVERWGSQAEVCAQLRFGASGHGAPGGGGQAAGVGWGALNPHGQQVKRLASEQRSLEHASLFFPFSGTAQEDK